MVDETNTDIEAQLRAAVSGTVLVPGDDAYEQARTVYHGSMTQRPAVIVQPANAADVSKVVSIARETGVPFAVKSGGHSHFALVEGGLVLDMSSMKDIQVDAESGTAWAEAGITAGEYTTAAHEHGLANGFGDTGTVGLGGLITGAGVGYLARKWGLTIDDLLAVEVVTADGEVRQADAEHEPDLFWAIRGGGGNFGVVTRVRLRLHELSTVYAGLLALPATPEVIAGFVKQSLEAPEELTSILNILPSPPLPFVPEELHGTPIAMAFMVYAGEGAAAERAVAPFRALATPIADFIAQIPYPEIYPEEDEWHPTAAARNLYADSIDADDAALILERLKASTAVISAVQLRPLGGAVTRVADDATAFSHRKRNVNINVAAIYEDPATVEQHTRWANALTAALQKGVPGVYVNFLADDVNDRVGEAYSEQTLARLREIKRSYDPTNLFRVNANIPPADE